MLDFIFGNMQAYQQVGLFVGALICFSFGALLLGNFIYWRLRGLPATGTIIGVVDQGGIYAPVYRYTAADGRVHEAKSTIGSSTISGKETGRVVRLLVSPHDSAQVQDADFGWVEMLPVVAGVLMVLAGVWMGFTAITAYPLTARTWIMAAVMAFFGYWHLRRSIVRNVQTLSALQAWRNAPDDGARSGIAGVQPIEQIVSSADAQQASAAASQQRKWAAPFVLMFAVLLAGIAVHQAASLARLQSVGSRAEGQVISLSSSYSSSSRSYSYYPVVRFRPASNQVIEFKDSIGSNPPGYRVGDKVTVLYLPDNPRAQAMIDRGQFWNWAIPVALGAGALLCFWLFLFVRGGGSQSGGISGAAPPRTARFTV